MKDKKLLNKLRLGDPSAYKYLFSEYYVGLSNYVLKLCGNRLLAEDIVQDTIVNIWVKKESLTIKKSLRKYLYTSCHNQFLQHIRKEKMNFDSLDKVKWDVLAKLETEQEEEDLYEVKIDKLHQLIDKLPPRCKEIFIKNKLEKQKYKDIAFELNISIKTVEGQMSKALHFLRENANSFLL